MESQGEPGFADESTVASLALAGWASTAEARIDSVLVTGRVAAVNLLVNGDYEYSVIFRRNYHGHWEESASSSGHMDASDLSRIEPA